MEWRPHQREHTVGDHLNGRHWGLALEDHIDGNLIGVDGGQREATGGNGRQREATGGNGRQREATGGHGRPQMGENGGICFVGPLH